MRITTIAILIGAILQAASFGLWAGEPTWLKDSASGCLVFSPSATPKETVTWSGACVDGKADGTGELAWYEDGILVLEESVTGTNGITMVAGKFSYSVSPEDVDFEIKECKKSDSGRKVYAFVKNGMALWQKQILMSIVNMGSEFAQMRCPKKTLRFLDIDIYYRSDRSAVMQSKYTYEPKLLQASAGNNIDWGFYTYKAKQDFFEPQRAKYEALRAEAQSRKDEAKKVALAQRNAEIERNKVALVPAIEREYASARKKYASNQQPGEEYGKGVFVYQNKSLIGSGLIKVESFKKTNGQRRNVFGVDYYSLYYDATVSFPMGTAEPCIKWSEGRFYECSWSKTENVSPSGRSVRVSGTISFEKTENGWIAEK